MPDTFLLPNILLFPRLLRRAGLPISPEQSLDFAQALTLVDIGNREQVYYTGRSLLVTRAEHIPLFTILFNHFWQTRGIITTRNTMPLAPRHRRDPHPIPFITLMAQKANPAHPEQDIADRAQTYSPAELLQRKEFSEMTPEELDTIRQLIQTMAWDITRRTTRRRVPDKHGRTLHLRRVLRSAAQYGGVPLRLAYQSRKVKQRPLILIADVSGSMEKYARLLLQFFYSVSHRFHHVETFLFGTRLTRITGQLKLKNMDRAIADASREVVDWAGGTRIGDSLRTFNHRWSGRLLQRGAIVIIVSDGWERGDPAALAREMRYLQRRAYRLIWLNPLLGKATYQPLVEGIAAARPYIDDFLPIHNLQSLIALSKHLAALRSNH
jgi:uncharacterized protein with von Willebrand factor type A (vWA) domain